MYTCVIFNNREHLFHQKLLTFQRVFVQIVKLYTFAYKHVHGNCSNFLQSLKIFLSTVCNCYFYVTHILKHVYYIALKMHQTIYGENPSIGKFIVLVIFFRTVKFKLDLIMCQWSLCRGQSYINPKRNVLVHKIVVTYAKFLFVSEVTEKPSCPSW